MEFFPLDGYLVWSVWNGPRAMHFRMRKSLARGLSHVLDSWVGGTWPPKPAAVLPPAGHEPRHAHGWGAKPRSLPPPPPLPRPGRAGVAS